MFYGFGKFFCSSFREIGLAYRCRPFFVWMCFVSSFSAAVVSFASQYPWVDNSGTVVYKTGRPAKYYTEQEILEEWQPYLPSAMPSPSSVSYVYEWLATNGYYNYITPPTLCAITNTERVVDFGQLYVEATNRLVAVAVAPSIGNSTSEDSGSVYLFPAYYSSRYGLGFIGPDGLDYHGSSPAFGGTASWGVDMGIFTTNLFTVNPWSFTDYQDNVPIVYPSQSMDGQGFFRRSRAFFNGSLRVLNVYYCFPLSPLMGRYESSSGYPVTRLVAFSLVDEFWLPWYWQTASGVVWWRDGDTMKLRNVLRFHSSSTNQPSDI